MVGSQTGVSKGASHGVGHVLGGTAGVPHGYTSCVMLPHVLRFNHRRQRRKAGTGSEALGRPKYRRPRGRRADIRSRAADPTCATSESSRGSSTDRRELYARPVDSHEPRKIDGPAVIRTLPRRRLVGQPPLA